MAQQQHISWILVMNPFTISFVAYATIVTAIFGEEAASAHADWIINEFFPNWKFYGSLIFGFYCVYTWVLKKKIKNFFSKVFNKKKEVQQHT